MTENIKAFLASSVVILLLIILYIGLNQNPSDIHSPVIDQSVPHFSGFKVGDHSPISDQDLKGHAYILNIWSTWCSSCVIEHSVLMHAHDQTLPIVGILYNDNVKSAEQWLVQHGNPYSYLVDDPKGQLIINLGVYGTPETLIVDEQGIIRKRFIGPVTNDWIKRSIEEFTA